MSGIQKVLSLTQKKRCMIKHFYCGNTLSLEKLIQISVLILIQMRDLRQILNLGGASFSIATSPRCKGECYSFP